MLLPRILLAIWRLDDSQNNVPAKRVFFLFESSQTGRSRDSSV